MPSAATTAESPKLKVVYEDRVVSCDECASIRRAVLVTGDRKTTAMLALWCQVHKFIPHRGFCCTDFQPREEGDSGPGSHARKVTPELECTEPNNPSCVCAACESTDFPKPVSAS